MKNSQWCYFAWESVWWGFCFCVVVVHFLCVSLFVNDLHFVVVSSFDFQATLPCHQHSTLAFQAREGLHQLWALPRLLLIAFSFSFTASATVLSGLFLPTGVFYLMLLPNIFSTTWFYQGFSGSRQLFLKICRSSYWSSKHSPGPSVCLIHNLLFILNLCLYMSILQKFLLVVKTLIENIDQQPHYSAAMKI